MKTVMLMISLMSLSVLAAEPSLQTTKSVGATTTVSYLGETRDCQVQNGPGVIMYGLCYKEGNTVIFKSCADFTCRLDKDVVAGPLDAGAEACFKDKDPEKFKAAALTEHQVKKVSQIHSCGYGAKTRGAR
jgi:hypothetical protein